MFTSPYPAGGRATEEDERHLLEWQADDGAAPDSHSATVDGLGAGHAERNQRYYLRTNKVSASFVWEMSGISTSFF